MDLQNISLDAVRSRPVAILGYGNQGRAQARNLRDSGVSVEIGARPGKAFEEALADGFQPKSFEGAAERADILMFLFPDQVIASIYSALSGAIQKRPRLIGFAHGFAFHFGLVERIKGCGYFLVGPKGAGTVLRNSYENKVGLPMVIAADEKSDVNIREIAASYAKAIGANFLLETTFQEETECDLFGEQAVLCGGLMELMEQAFGVLVEAGHSPEMAFFETCFEVRMILDVFLSYGPKGMREKISPTAFYGGLTRGKRLVTSETRKEMDRIFCEIKSGAFAREWLQEAHNGKPRLQEATDRYQNSALEKVFQKLKTSAKF